MWWNDDVLVFGQYNYVGGDAKVVAIAKSVEVVNNVVKVDLGPKENKGRKVRYRADLLRG